MVHYSSEDRSFYSHIPWTTKIPHTQLFLLDFLQDYFKPRLIKLWNLTEKNSEYRGIAENLKSQEEVQYLQNQQYQENSLMTKQTFARYAPRETPRAKKQFCYSRIICTVIFKAPRNLLMHLLHRTSDFPPITQRTALVELLIPTLSLGRKPSLLRRAVPLCQPEAKPTTRRTSCHLLHHLNKKDSRARRSSRNRKGWEGLFHLCTGGHTDSRILADYQTAKERL